MDEHGRVVFDLKGYVVKPAVLPEGELAEVIEDQGGTCFIPGSHKASYRLRKGIESIDARDSGLWQSYGCPPGSLVIFSEAVRHSADVWRNPHNPRIALFCTHNHIC